MAARILGSIKFRNFTRSSLPSWVRKHSSRYVVNIDPLPTRYGGKTNVTVLPGVGIGPEITESALKVLKAANAPLSYEILLLPSNEETKVSEEFQDALTSIRRNKVALKGNIETRSRNPHLNSRNVLLRKTLDLFAYVVRCKTLPGLVNKFGEIDVILIRQNTEGEYLMLEHEPTQGTVESLKIITRYASEKLARFAFNYAQEHKRKLITVAHSANVQRATEGLFVQAALSISGEFPAVKVKIEEVGVLVSNIVINPKLYDIILATNLNGSMILNLLNGMLGGPALSAGTNYGENGIMVFEPGARNKGTSIVGQGIANPMGMIMAGINLLDYLGYNKTARILEHALHSTLAFDKVHTRDLGGTATTKQFTANIITHIKKQLRPKMDMKGSHLHSNWRKYCEIPLDFNPKKKS